MVQQTGEALVRLGRGPRRQSAPACARALRSSLGVVPTACVPAATATCTAPKSALVALHARPPQPALLTLGGGSAPLRISALPPEPLVTCTVAWGFT